MIDHATEQLALLHNTSRGKIRKLLVGACADWTVDPVGGGWNFWRPQVDVQQAMQEIRRPLGQKARCTSSGTPTRASRAGWRVR
jgi:hypothetical protein